MHALTVNMFPSNLNILKIYFYNYHTSAAAKTRKFSPGSGFQTRTRTRTQTWKYLKTFVKRAYEKGAFNDDGNKCAYEN